MSKSLLFTIITLLVSFSYFSQIESSKPTIYIKSPEPIIYKYQKGLGIETFYQYTNGIGLGGIIGDNIGHKSNRQSSKKLWSITERILNLVRIL